MHDHSSKVFLETFVWNPASMANANKFGFEGQRPIYLGDWGSHFALCRQIVERAGTPSLLSRGFANNQNPKSPFPSNTHLVIHLFKNVPSSSHPITFCKKYPDIWFSDSVLLSASLCCLALTLPSSTLIFCLDFLGLSCAAPTCFFGKAHLGSGRKEVHWEQRAGLPKHKL